MCHIKEGEVLLAVARARLTQAADKYSLCNRISTPTNQIKCKSPFSNQEFIKYQGIHSNIQLASFIPERSPFYDMISGHFDLRKKCLKVMTHL